MIEWILSTLIPGAIGLYSVFWMPLFLSRFIWKYRVYAVCVSALMLSYVMYPAFYFIRWIERDWRILERPTYLVAEYLKYMNLSPLLLFVLGIWVTLIYTWSERT